MYIKNQDIVARKIHDSFFLINITDNYLDDKCRLYELNEIGYFIWNQLEDTGELSVIVDALKSNINGDVDYNVLLDDVKEYLDVLVDERFVRVE